MRTNLSDLTSLEKANKDYLSGLELLQTSCIKCRCNPNYLDAILYFKKAANVYHGCQNFVKEVSTREYLVRCLNKEKSFWEEGNEYEKISKVQLNQLNEFEKAYISIINSFNAYANNHSYDDGIKALSKSSNEFIDARKKEKAKEILDFAFKGIDKYYHILTLNKEESHNYIYECIDKYIDLLFSENEYKKSAEISLKASQLLEREQKDEKRLICKYYGFQAISELLNKEDEKYKESVKKGKEYELDDINICTKIDKLVDIVRQKSEENEKLIKIRFEEISRQDPSSIAKMMNIQFIQVNKVTSNVTIEIKTDLIEEEDL